MTYRNEREAVDITLRASGAALAWANAFLATSDNPYRPTLYRTLLLEVFPDGIQFVATNGTALFRTWCQRVPEKEETWWDRPWPELEEAPLRSLVVMDGAGFALGFMRLLAAATKEDDKQFENLRIESFADRTGDPPLGDEFWPERLVLSALGQRTECALLGGAYPDWRQAQFGMDEVERVDSMALATRMFGLVAKIKQAGRVDLEFSGKETRIGFTARDIGFERVRGLLMPMQRTGETET